MHKKDSKTSEDHYRPVSILPNNLKIYERFMFKQMSKYFEPFFKKNFSVVSGKVLAPTIIFCQSLEMEMEISSQ